MKGKGMMMSRILIFTLCLVALIAITAAINPVDEVDESELETVTRSIRGSSSVSGNGRKRARSRHRSGRGRSTISEDGVGVRVQKRKLSSGNRPTRAPLFEASPPDPFINGRLVEHTTEYGHSHSPPTPDPYYSPSKVERERKRQRRIKLARQNIAPITENNFEQEESPVSAEFQKREKNYAFAYAVGDQEEDFSHKQAKDGALTVGEYRITLPDGRTQVVRYTAGGKHGYKADVTYEPPNGNNNDHHNGKVKVLNTVPLHQNHQYHSSVQPTYHLSATPVPSVNSNRIYKSRPLKSITLQTNEDVEYSPGTEEEEEEDKVEYRLPTPVRHQPTPKIRLKAGGGIPGPPSYGGAEFINGVSTTPTPRPNSIYDKISPYRNGASNKYTGSDELAFAHEKSPRAGPRSNKQKKVIVAGVNPNSATVYGSPILASPTPYTLPKKVKVSPTKRYKNPSYYVSGAGTHNQPQTHHEPTEQYIRPLKHIQYLQETPIHHNHHHHTGGIVSKAVKQQQQGIITIGDHYKANPISSHIAYTPQSVILTKPRKSKKVKQHSLLHQGQYLLQSPITATVPTTPHYQIKSNQQQHQHSPFQYYNSFLEPHHHHTYDGQLLSSPKPTTSVRHSESPFPNAYPVTAFPLPTGLSGGGGGSLINRLPSAPSHFHHGGHGYLESPASGDRPNNNRLKIKEALSRLPVNDLPTPKTTIHPYEVGSADYGKGVAYGNAKGREKLYPDANYAPFPSVDGGLEDFDHINPTNSIFSASAPSAGALTGSSGVNYFPSQVSDQFNFLDGFHSFDIEQANVREIRQPRRTRSGKKSSSSSNNSNSQFSSRRLQRQPAQSSSSSSEEVRKRSPRRRQSTSTTTKTTSKPKVETTTTTTTRSRGRRRRVRTQQQN